ncbi:MAG: helix-turn-helix domain-containing protein [Pseudomonadota bacterium]
MATRSYSQTCSIANFLDMLGGRWTLLIVRDLLIGPRRFKQLLAGLPGIGTNLLAQRLKELQSLGIVVRDRDEQHYVLTNIGQELEPVIVSMARWSLQHLAVDQQGKLNRDELLVVAFRAAFTPPAADHPDEEYEFRIGATHFVLEVNQGELHSYLGSSAKPEFIFTTDSTSFGAIVGGTLSIAQAEERQQLQVLGSRDALARWLAMWNSTPDSDRALND